MGRLAPISASTSTYLNLLRGLAATAVVLFHYQDKHFGPDWLTRYFPSNGKGYVMIFFVISGFVISMTAEKLTAKAFAIDRAVRIYIVAIPVLMLVCCFPSLCRTLCQARTPTAHPRKHSS
jgi:peptidoglycan/LPS O-acetylase OafA/YrhL